MAYARGVRRDPPDAALDAMLLKAFPGRMLEELDGMDWGRWQRAAEAQMRLDVETLRARTFEGNGKFSDLPEGVMRMIQEHDALVEDDDGDA